MGLQNDRNPQRRECKSQYPASGLRSHRRCFRRDGGRRGVAFTAIRDATIRFGETVAVFGEGVVGLITAQIAKQSGADPVIAVDLYDKRLKSAKKL